MNKILFALFFTCSTASAINGDSIAPLPLVYGITSNHSIEKNKSQALAGDREAAHQLGRYLN